MRDCQEPEFRTMKLSISIGYSHHSLPSTINLRKKYSIMDKKIRVSMLETFSLTV